MCCISRNFRCVIDKKGIKINKTSLSENKSNMKHLINPPDPNESFIITKSSWAGGRPIPLVRETDRKGLNFEIVKNQIDSGGSKKRRKREGNVVNVEVGQ